MSDNPEHLCKLNTEPTGRTVWNTIARRVSCRAYQPQAVPQAQVMQILESCPARPVGLQPATVAVCPCDPDAGSPPAFRRKPLAELVRWL